MFLFKIFNDIHILIFACKFLFILFIPSLLEIFSSYSHEMRILAVFFLKSIQQKYDWEVSQIYRPLPEYQERCLLTTDRGEQMEQSSRHVNHIIINLKVGAKDTKFAGTANSKHSMFKMSNKYLV